MKFCKIISEFGLLVVDGAEAYVNFFLTAMGCYDPKDKKLYAIE